MMLKYEKVSITIDYNEAVSIRNALSKGTDSFKSDPDEKAAKELFQLLDGFLFSKRPRSDS